MNLSAKGLALIKRFEGFSAKPYRCSAGVPTIGYGSTYYEDGRPVQMDDPDITEEWAEALLINLVRSFEQAVNSMVQQQLTQNQFDALVSFTYNVGIEAFRKSTLLKRVNNDPFDPDINRQFLKWVNAGGRVRAGLVKRRQREARLYFKP